jgi:hypothetical protein
MFDKLKNLAFDKALHIIGGNIAGAVLAMVAIKVVQLPAWAWAFALGGGLGAGLAKEAIDAIGNKVRARTGQLQLNTVERADIRFTTLGAVPVAAPLLLLSLMARGLV